MAVAAGGIAVFLADTVGNMPGKRLFAVISRQNETSLNQQEVSFINGFEGTLSGIVLGKGLIKSADEKIRILPRQGGFLLGVAWSSPFG